jgi:TetR/AcrR family fatty acid metabolism transcriptional regulator
VLPEGRGPRGRRRLAELGRTLLERGHRSDHDVLGVEALEPGCQLFRGEGLRQGGAQRLLRLRVVLPLDQLLAADQLAEAPEELGLDRRNSEVAAVRCLVDGVAGEPAREEAFERLTSQAMRGEAVGPVRHGDLDSTAAPGSLPLVERGKDLGYGAERAGSEVGDLYGRECGSGVGEGARPAEVVEVVAGASGVPPFGAEAGDRAVDDRVGQLGRADAEPVRHAGSEAVEDDVGAAAESVPEVAIRLQVARDRFLARVERGVPAGSDLAHGVSLGRFETHHPCPEPKQLPAGERAGEVAGEVDDEDAGQWLHRANLYSPRLTERSIIASDKRTLILHAAVRVFARKGYHAARVGDIAAEAGVAHGLLYHYFDSKEKLLESIFRETWTELLEALEQVEVDVRPADEQLRQVAAILLRSWRRDPDLVRVLVREVARSPQLGGRVDEIEKAFAVIERIIERGQSAGELRRDVDARLAAWIVYGALEEILTGWVLGTLPDGDDAVADAERTIVQVFSSGLTTTGLPARAPRKRAATPLRRGR